MVRFRVKAAISLILKRPVEETAPQKPRPYTPPDGEPFQACSQCPEPNRLFLEVRGSQETVICGDCGGRVLLLSPTEDTCWVT